MCNLLDSSTLQSTVDSIQNGSRLHLGRALSWIESTLPTQRAFGNEVVKALLHSRATQSKRANSTVRIGITGPPGAGKVGMGWIGGFPLFLRFL